LVYKVDLETPIKDFVFLADNLPQVNRYEWNNEDTGFQEHGHYLSLPRKTPGFSKFNPGVEELAGDIFYPFRSLFTGRKQEELKFEVEDKGDSWIFRSNFQFSIFNFQLFTPELSKTESVFWTKDLKEEPIATPSVEIKNNKVEVKVDKKKGYFSYDSQDDPNFFNLEPHSCNPFNTGEMKREMVKESNHQILRFTSIGSSNCLSVNLPHFVQKTGYLVKVKARHLQGKSLLFKVINETLKNTVIETNLQKSNPGVVLQSGTTPGLVESQKSPRLSGYLTSGVRYSGNLGKDDFQVIHPNPSFYKISINNEAMKQWNNGTMILSQSFHPGWTAYQVQNSKSKMQNYLTNTFPFIFGQRLNDHILVNNWQNGWILNNLTLNHSSLKNGLRPVISSISGSGQAMKQFNNKAIYLFFWPQLLEYLGFLLLLLFLLKLIIIKSKKL